MAISLYLIKIFVRENASLLMYCNKTENVKTMKIVKRSNSVKYMRVKIYLPLKHFILMLQLLGFCCTKRANSWTPQDLNFRLIIPILEAAFKAFHAEHILLKYFVTEKIKDQNFFWSFCATVRCLQSRVSSWHLRDQTRNKLRKFWIATQLPRTFAYSLRRWAVLSRFPESAFIEYLSLMWAME